jgi:hypothetical protein
VLLKATQQLALLKATRQSALLKVYLICLVLKEDTTMMISDILVLRSNSLSHQCLHLQKRLFIRLVQDKTHLNTENNHVDE